MKNVVIDARRFTDADASHAYLARKLRAPDYYGANLDALYDILTERTEPTCVLAMQSARAGAAWPGFCEVLEAAARENDRLRFRILS